MKQVSLINGGIPNWDGMDQNSRLLHAVNGAAEILLTTDEEGFEDSLRKGMELVAGCMEIDRVYIWQNQIINGCLQYVPQFEWLSSSQPEGGIVHPKECFLYTESIPEWESLFLQGKCVNGPLCSLSQVEQERLEPYGIKSILVIPVHLKDIFWGFVSYDDCRRERIFTEDEVSILRSASLMLTSAMNRNDATDRIHNAVDEAQSANKAKSAFLAHMSHEIRTPMNVIAGMIELMMREDMPKAVYEYAMSIKHASANMLSLVNDILDFSKIEAGSLEIIRTEYLLTSLIYNVLITIRMKVSEKPVLFTANIDCNIPNRLIGDETRIRQIFLNVLDNAAKYTVEGFISLSVTGVVHEDTVVLTVEISDSGVGIEQENMDKLFSNFMRFDGERHKKIQGTGLGLPITKSLCQALGGNISVRSEYGAGSIFTITIPQKIKSHDEKFASVSDPETKTVLLYETRAMYADSILLSLDNLGVPCMLVTDEKNFYEELKRRPYPFAFVSSSQSVSAGQMIEKLKLDTRLVVIIAFGEKPAMRNVRTIFTPVHVATIANILDDIEDNILYGQSSRQNMRFIAPNAKILVVDDLNTNLKVAEGLMLPYKMQIDICESGEEAITYVQKKQYDIIFMDHMMLGIDGIETTNIIRAMKDEDGYYERVPIIALTANTVSGVKEMFLQNGMNDFLAKPIDITKLHALLEKWIPAKKKERPRKTRTYRSAVQTGNHAQIEIEGVNVQAGITMTGGTLDRYLKTLTVFHMDASDKINKIWDCVEKKDIKLYTTYVHALKSAAANIGARDVSYLFKNLGIAGTSGDIGFIHENTGHALRELEMLIKNIETIISTNQREPAKESDSVFLRNELLKLKEALSRRDAGEIDDIMNALVAVKWDPSAVELFKKVSGNIFMVNYVDASVLIDKLLMAISE